MKINLTLVPVNIIDACERFLNLKEATATARAQCFLYYSRFGAPEKRPVPHIRYSDAIQEENAAYREFRDACIAKGIDERAVCSAVENKRNQT